MRLIQRHTGQLELGALERDVGLNVRDVERASRHRCDCVDTSCDFGSHVFIHKRQERALRNRIDAQCCVCAVRLARQCFSVGLGEHVAEHGGRQLSRGAQCCPLPRGPQLAQIEETTRVGGLQRHVTHGRQRAGTERTGSDREVRVYLWRLQSDRAHAPAGQWRLSLRFLQGRAPAAQTAPDQKAILRA